MKKKNIIMVSTVLCIVSLSLYSADMHNGNPVSKLNIHGLASGMMKMRTAAGVLFGGKLKNVRQRLDERTIEVFAGELVPGQRYSLPLSTIAVLSDMSYSEPHSQESRPRMETITLTLVCHSPEKIRAGMIQLELTVPREVQLQFLQIDIPVVGGGVFSEVTQLFQQTADYSYRIREGALGDIIFQVVPDSHGRSWHWQSVGPPSEGEDVLIIFGRLVRAGSRAK